MQVNATQAMEHIVACMKENLVPMLSGPPGTGKSDIMRAIADKYKLKLIDIRLSQCDPTDLNFRVSYR